MTIFFHLVEYDNETRGSILYRGTICSLTENMPFSYRIILVSVSALSKVFSKYLYFSKHIFYGARTTKRDKGWITKKKITPFEVREKKDDH